MTAHKPQNQKRIWFSASFSRIVSWTRFAFLVLLLLGALTVSPWDNASVGSTKRVSQVPLVLLESSEDAINHGSSARAIALSASDGQVVYAVDRSTEEVVVHETQRKSSRKIKSFVPPANVESIAVGSEGNIYIADSESSQVRVMSSAGKSHHIVPVAQPYSLGVLGNGNLVVASSAGMDLFYLYGPRGSRLGSFGEMRSFDTKNYRQNRFLNKGKIAIGPSDTIYYVSRFAPVPTVQKFSSDGKLLSEFAINGDAIDFQLKVGNDFLREKGSGVAGGFEIVTSATVDPSTGHLWVSTNGTSKTGVVYEYDSTGVKLNEYAFVLKGPSGYTRIITGVKDLAVRSRSIYLLTWEGSLYRFSMDNLAKVSPGGGKNQIAGRLSGSRSGSFFSTPAVSPTHPLSALELPCPPAQTLLCTANCPTNSTSETVNCADEVMRHSAGDRLVGWTCEVPGSSCSATGNFCNTTTGATTTISSSMLCTSSGGGEGEGSPPCNPPCPVGAGMICYAGLCTEMSPIVVDISGNGIDLTDSVNGINFDFNGDKRLERVSWTSMSSDNAWLVLDRNSNGLIDDGTELFGNITPQPVSASPNGFLALAEFDKPEQGGNGDGRIDNRDTIFSSLRLWQDTNHNGLSEAAELHLLPSLNIEAFDLDYRLSRRVDRYGNQFRYRAKVYDKSGARAGRWAWDVYLQGS